jgi:hypothetical protein
VAQQQIREIYWEQGIARRAGLPRRRRPVPDRPRGQPAQGGRIRGVLVRVDLGLGTGGNDTAYELPDGLSRCLGVWVTVAVLEHGTFVPLGRSHRATAA